MGSAAGGYNESNVTRLSLMQPKLSNPARFLLMKTSSLGDVLHNLAVVSDLRRVFPGAAVDWCVEAPFAEIPAWHTGVRRVIPVAIRRWRKSLFNADTWAEIRLALSALRSEHYDAIIDTQGLVRSVLLAQLAHGPVYGQNRHEAREALSGLLVTHPLNVPYSLHAVDRYRMIAATALGYADRLPSLPLDFGLDDRFPRQPGNEVFLFTNTSRDKKLWPEGDWINVGRQLRSVGLVPVFTAGNEIEAARSQRIAAGIAEGDTLGEILFRPTLTQLTERLSKARLCLGVDTGFTHIACALEIPTIAIFTDTDPALAGGFGLGQRATFGHLDTIPPVADVVGQLRTWGVLPA
ncbi:MAG: ADP-heptose--LPS heptosyltransferase [Pseudomonadota bacterium]